MARDARPFLDFYEKNSIIPTDQIIANSSDYERARRFLFQQLGMPPSWLEDKSVFELGPGNGQKAEYLLRLCPALYVAVDGNPTSVKQTRERLGSLESRTLVEVVQVDFLALDEVRRFDLVIAESVIPTQEHPEQFLRKLLGLAKPGGVILFTCMDSGSLLSEILRRAISSSLIEAAQPLDTQAQILAEFFMEDLDCLEGMTRVAKDWVVDQLLHPWVGPPLDIPTALASLEGRVDFLGSSPRFVNDWRWYKSHRINESSTGVASVEFWSVAHNLLDHRVVLPARNPALNQELFRATRNVYDQVMGHHYDALTDLTEAVVRVSGLLPEDAHVTKQSIGAFLAYASDLNPERLELMRSWWGRGQQYVTVIANEGRSGV